MDKEVINTALGRIDNRITPSDFHDDWRSAMRLVNGPSGAKHLEVEVNVLDRLVQFLHSHSTGLSTVVVGLMICVLIVIMSSDIFNEDPGTGIVKNRDMIMPLDPNSPWYGPTDDLLQVDVLKYETQLVTFAYYDPITMEIK